MRIVVTGLGVVSPFGVGRASWEEALASPGVARERAFAGQSSVLETLPDARTAEVWGWDAGSHLGDKGHRSNDRLTKFMIAAARYALEDAGIKRGGEFVPDAPGPIEIGICSATAYGSLDAITELNRVAELEDPRYINPTRFPNTVINAAAGYVSIWQDLRAPNTTIVDGNCGALDAVLTGETHLRHGRARAFLIGGGEVVSEPLYRAMARLGVLADSRPDRKGLEMGEGACYAVSERPEHAAKRGAPIRAVLAGYGTAFEPPASEALLIHVDRVAVRRAMEQALEDAGLGPRDIDVVVSARCGLDLLDVAEEQGTADALGTDVAVVGLKRLHGETFGAAGAFGIAAAIAYFGGARPAPILSGKLPSEIRTVMVVTVGYYGNVTAVVVTRPDVLPLSS